MAEVIEISNTKHLTVSPLNERHNILYYRARKNVNQRHIQKPWFDLNPFLDKDDDKGINLELYRPENDRGVQPLQSLTVVEDYFSEKPLLTREFRIAEFWNFLFSDDWSDGYSVRVLEGRLQNLMLTCLASLTSAGCVVQHTTRAFAKNRRKRYSIYKLSTKPPEIGRYEETLLLEFIYYGNVMRTSGHVQEELYESSAGYPQITTCSTLTSITPSSDLESSDCSNAGSLILPISSSEIEGSLIRPTPPSGPKPARQRPQSIQKKIRGHREQPHPKKDKAPINKSLSRVKGEEHKFVGIPRGTMRREHRSDISSGSDDYSFPQKIDLNKFMCTERISYLGEFNLPDESDSSDNEDEDEDFGQGFYLGNNIARRSPDPLESVENKLRKRKGEVRIKRQKLREMKEDLSKPAKPIFPEFSELDVKKYVLNYNVVTKKSDTSAAPEKVPDLVEFIEMMKDDEKIDPRHANYSKRKTLKFMMKYNLIKPDTEKFSDEVGGITDSLACRLHCYGMDDIWNVMSDKSKKKFLIQKMLQAGGKNSKPKKKVRRDFRKKRQFKIPLIYITTLSGLTYLHPVSKSILQQKLETGEIDFNVKNQTPSGQGRRRVSLIPGDTPLALELNKKRRPKTPIAETESTTLKVEKTASTKPIFPKATPLVAGTESPDYSSEEESDDLDDSSFDTKKLSIRYSLERIRKSKAERKKRAAARVPEFYKVLKKYYRMQAILRAFRPSSRRRSSSGSYRPPISGCTTMKRNKKRRQNSILDEMKIEEEVEASQIGKLKHFPFLEARRRLMEPLEDLDEPLFENYPMDLFKQNVERALDEFVVRREVVISDYNAKTTVSITLTRKSVFVKTRNM